MSVQLLWRRLVSRNQGPPGKKFRREGGQLSMRNALQCVCRNAGGQLFSPRLCCDAASASASGVPGSSFGGCERFDAAPAVCPLRNGCKSVRIFLQGGETQGWQRRFAAGVERGKSSEISDGASNLPPGVAFRQHEGNI